MSMCVRVCVCKCVQVMKSCNKVHVHTTVALYIKILLYVRLSSAADI